MGCDPGVIHARRGNCWHAKNIMDVSKLVGGHQMVYTVMTQEIRTSQPLDVA